MTLPFDKSCNSTINDLKICLKNQTIVIQIELNSDYLSTKVVSEDRVRFDESLRRSVVFGNDANDAVVSGKTK